MVGRICNAAELPALFLAGNTWIPEHTGDGLDAVVAQELAEPVPGAMVQLDDFRSPEVCPAPGARGQLNCFEANRRQCFERSRMFLVPNEHVHAHVPLI